MKRRFGVFKLTWHIIENHPALVRLIMGQCIIIRVRGGDLIGAGHEDPVTYFALCDAFDEIEVTPGGEAPIYRAICKAGDFSHWEMVS